MLQPSSSRLRFATLAALTALSLSACVVVPAGRRYEADVVVMAPPAPQVEVIGVAPGPGWFWIGGYWNWVGGRHVWTGGRWEAQRPGYGWAPHRWVREGPQWRAEPGHWERR